MKKKINLPPMILCGDNLPWVTEGMHLGHLVTDSYDGMKGDVMLKRGQYIQKNCEIIQEFNFCHPHTKFKIKGRLANLLFLVFVCVFYTNYPEVMIVQPVLFLR